MMSRFCFGAAPSWGLGFSRRKNALPPPHLAIFQKKKNLNNLNIIIKISPEEGFIFLLLFFSPPHHFVWSSRIIGFFFVFLSSYCFSSIFSTNHDLVIHKSGCYLRCHGLPPFVIEFIGQAVHIQEGEPPTTYLSTMHRSSIWTRPSLMETTSRTDNERLIG